jgi:hypothetical protein
MSQLRRFLSVPRWSHSRGARQRVVAALLFPLMASEAAASCPRRMREQVRRVVPAVLFWPAAPFILRARPKSAPMPEVGAAARVSHRGKHDDAHFTEGRFVSRDDRGITLSHPDGSTVLIPMAEVLCLQTPRRAVSAGAGTGFTLGAATGVTTALVIGALESDRGARNEAFAIGAPLLGALGAVGGSLVGSAIRGTTWDTALDRSP